MPLVRDVGCTYHGCEVHGHSVCPAVGDHIDRLVKAGSTLVRCIKFLEQSVEFGMDGEPHSEAQSKMFMDYRAALNEFEEALNDDEPPRAAGG